MAHDLLDHSENIQRTRPESLVLGINPIGLT